MTHFGIGMVHRKALTRTAFAARPSLAGCLLAALLTWSPLLIGAENPSPAEPASESQAVAPAAAGVDTADQAAKEKAVATPSAKVEVVAKPKVPAAVNRPKTVIGAVSPVAETVSEINFAARVDTGATTCSMHVEEWSIEDGDESMQKNVGKTIRFRIRNRSNKSEWLQREIIEVATVKTSEREELRYKVYMTLECNDVEKRVLVSLNDRSHMTYPVLLGRNFLEGDFLVDVSLRD